jgi:hypothetical protein
MRIADIISAVKARQDDIAKSLAEGHAYNYEAFQRLVGEVAGLQHSLTIINNLLEREEDDR